MPERSHTITPPPSAMPDTPPTLGLEALEPFVGQTESY